jgi:RibD C-terminal domain
MGSSRAERGARLGRLLGGSLRHYRQGRRDDPGAPDVSRVRAVLAGRAGQPNGILPFTGRPATQGEIEYAAFGCRTQQIVVSNTLQTVSWKNTRIVRDLEEVRRLKKVPGSDMHAVGGATLVSSLMNAGLVDEIRLVVQPIVPGGGKPLFKDVKERHALTLLAARTW